jgi:hypothetical protein
LSPVPIGSTLGAVSFYSNGVLLGSGSVAINPFGVATYTTTGLAAGSHAITAVFSGNASYSTSTSAAIIETITAATTSILTVAPNPVVAGQSAIVTLTISPAPTGSPLGTVSFYNGSILLWTGTVNSSGVAIFSTTTLPLGTDSITAAYSGNAGFAGSTSTAISVQVNSANATATVTAITSSNLAPTYGQSVTLTATVTPAPSGTPPGTLSFYAGTTLLGTEALNAHGVGIVSLSLPLGPNAITAVYSGSAGFAASRSSALSISNRALSAIMLSASPTTQLATMPVVFTGLVNSATPGVQTGTVSFLNGSTVLATVTIVAGQPAVYSDPALSSGPYSVTATYSGDTSFLPSVSSGAPIAITVGNLNLALGGDNNKTVVPGGAVTYNFPLSPLVTPTFLYVVHLTASGLPPGATYTFTPASIPAGSGPIPVAFTVQTAAPTAMLGRPGRQRQGPMVRAGLRPVACRWPGPGALGRGCGPRPRTRGCWRWFGHARPGCGARPRVVADRAASWAPPKGKPSSPSPSPRPAQTWCGPVPSSSILSRERYRSHEEIGCRGYYRLAVLGLALGMCGPAVLAQQDRVSPAHPVQFAFNYSYMRANAAPGQCGCFNMTGGSGEFAVQAWRGFSVVADLTGEFAGSSNIPGQSLALVFVTAGPRFTYHPHRFHRYAPFAQGLVGVVHGFDAPFPNNSGSTTNAASALAALLAAAWTSPSTVTSQSGPSRPTTATRNCPIASTPIRISSATPRASCCAPGKREQFCLKQPSSLGSNELEFLPQIDNELLSRHALVGMSFVVPHMLIRALILRLDRFRGEWMWP